MKITQKRRWRHVQGSFVVAVVLITLVYFQMGGFLLQLAAGGFGALTLFLLLFVWLYDDDEGFNVDNGYADGFYRKDVRVKEDYHWRKKAKSDNSPS